MKQASLFLIYDGVERFLCVGRRDSDKFGLIGGKVDEGETPLEAGIRECEEEAGLRFYEFQNIPLVFSSVVGNYETFTHLIVKPITMHVEVERKEDLPLAWLTAKELIEKSEFPDYNKTLFEKLYGVSI